MQELVRGFITTGQLEFINGGWDMHDEANPSFVDMIDQTTLGVRWLLQEFNVTPKTTWQCVCRCGRGQHVRAHTLPRLSHCSHTGLTRSDTPASRAP